MIAKPCNCCHQWLPPQAFSPRRLLRASAECRQCNTEYAASRPLSPEKRAARAEYLKQWRAANPDYTQNRRNDRNAWRRQYYAAKREELRTYANDWRLKNVEKERARDRRYSKEHPEKFAYYASKRRARLAGAAGSHTLQEWQLVLRQHRHRCAKCGAKGKLEKDHIIPIARGGSDYAFNLQPLCESCNLRKNARIELGAQYSLFDRTT